MDAVGLLSCVKSDCKSTLWPNAATVVRQRLSINKTRNHMNHVETTFFGFDSTARQMAYTHSRGYTVPPGNYAHM